MFWRIKHYFRRLMDMDWHGFRQAIQQAHEKSGKSRIIIFFDMIACSIKYTAGYVDYNEFEFYLLNAQERRSYLTMGDGNRVIVHYNDPSKRKFLDDKGEFARWYSQFLGREMLDLRQGDVKNLEDFIKKHQIVVVKKFDGMTGAGVAFIERESVDDFVALYQSLKANQQYIVEELIQQHPEMSRLAPKSVNSIRMITFIDDAGEPQLLVAALKCGLDSALDNINRGGMYTVLEDGVVAYAFVDYTGTTYTQHPVSGAQFLGFKVPYYQEAVAMVKEAALVIPEIRYIGWDVAITPTGPLIIEGNYNSGIFQIIPSTTKNPHGLRAEYKQYMDIIK